MLRKTAVPPLDVRRCSGRTVRVFWICALSHEADDTFEAFRRASKKGLDSWELPQNSPRVTVRQELCHGDHKGAHTENHLEANSSNEGFTCGLGICKVQRRLDRTTVDLRYISPKIRIESGYINVLVTRYKTNNVCYPPEQENRQSRNKSREKRKAVAQAPRDIYRSIFIIV